jgi:putative inorganic carbon (hco3(-)) transporter
MLRTIFITLLFFAGWAYALQSALYAACLYLWIAYFRPESWVWGPVVASLNMSFLAGVFLLFRSVISGVKIQLTLGNSLLILFLVHSVVSSVFGIDPAYSYPPLELFAKTVIVSFLLTILIKTPADLRLILTVIALSLGFETAKQGWVQLVLNPGARNDNPVPFLGDNNLVAVGMAMLMPILTALAGSSRGLWKRGLQFTTIGVVYRGLSTYSRGGLLAFSTVGALQLLRSRHKFRALVGAAVVVALVLPALPPEYWGRMNTLTASGEDRDESSQGRLHFWQVAISIAGDHPLLGVGHSGFQRAYNRYDTSGGQFGTDRAVHSAWFGILSELGYTGLLLFIAIILTSVLACRRVRKWSKQRRIPEEMGAYATGLESSLIAFLVGGTFVSFHYCEMLWHVFALTMALESVAVRELAKASVTSAKAPEKVGPVVTLPEKEPEFAWG